MPDILANVATNAWWWWVVFGDIAPSPDAAFARISTTMRRLVAAVADDAERGGRAYGSPPSRSPTATPQRSPKGTVPPTRPIV